MVYRTMTDQTITSTLDQDQVFAILGEATGLDFFTNDAGSICVEFASAEGIIRGVTTVDEFKLDRRDDDGTTVIEAVAEIPISRLQPKKRGRKPKGDA